MKDTNSPQEEVGPTSPKTPNAPGVFSPAQTKVDPKKAIGGEIRAASGVFGSPEEQNPQESRDYILGQIDNMLKRIERLQLSAPDWGPELKIILEDIEMTKDSLQEGPVLIGQIQARLLQKEAEILAIEKEIFDEVTFERSKLLRLESLLITWENYMNIIHTCQSDISRVQSSDMTSPLKNSILSTLKELEWLRKRETFKELADDENLDLEGVDTKLEILYNEITEAIIILDQKESEQAKTEALRKITEEGDELSKSYRNYREKIKKLNVHDASLISSRDILEDQINAAEAAFFESPSNDTLLAFFESFNEYPELFQKMKDRVVPTIAVPEFLRGTIIPEEAIEPASFPKEAPTPESPALENTPSDDTSIEGLVGNWESGYSVNTGTEQIVIKNERIPGTLLRYKNLQEKSNGKNIDFTKATSHKDAVVQALVSKKGDQATTEAKALGSELDLIIKKHFTVPDVIVATCDNYKRLLNDPKNTDIDFSQATTLNDEILKAISEGDIPRADKNARLLGDELKNPRLKKQASPEEVVSKIITARTDALDPSTLEEPTPSTAPTKPLRAAVSGSAPSPKQAEIALNKNFELQKTALVNAHEILEKILPLLTSEHEKIAFTRLSSELLELQNSITEAPTKKLIAEFTAKVERFTVELSKKERYVDAVYGKKRGSPSPFKQTLRLDTKVMRSKRLRGNDTPEETLEQWTARQTIQGSSRDFEETRQKKAKQELYDKHSEIFKKNPSLYTEIYGEKNNVRDPRTQDISGRVAREVVLDLENKRHEVLGEIIRLKADKLEGNYTDAYDEDLAILNRKVADLDSEIKKYTEINLTKTTTISPKNSLLRNKQVYSPRNDNTDMSEGLGRNYTLDEHNNPIKIDRAALTQVGIEDIYAQENNPLEDKAPGVRHLKEKVLLSDGLYPNHTEGMVPYLDEHKGMSASKAHTQEEGEAEEVVALEKQSKNPESQKERHTIVNKLTDVLFRYPSTRLHPWGWLAAGLSTLAISTATGYALGKALTTKNEGQTLGDVIKNQPSWRTLMSEDIPKWFIQNLSAPSDKNFTALIQVSAPSFAISEANPSAKEKISDLIVKDVYEFEDSGVGLTRNQQEEASLFIKRLQDILKVTQVKSGILYDKNALLFGDLTLRQLYQKTGEIIAATDKEEARLRKI